MSESTRDRLANYGKWTYRAAWALEITAALIGLATGLIIGFQASVNAGGTEAVSLVLASAPFFMVALAELTKIPIATLMYAVSWAWKPILLVFLVSLALITFETVSMGLERAATLRQMPYNELVEEIGILQSESKSLAANVTRLTETDEVQLAQASIQQITELAQTEQSNLRAQLDALDQQMAGGASSASLLLIQNQMREAEDKRTAIIKERETRISQRMAEFERQRSSFETRILDAKNRGEESLADQLEQQLAKLKNPTAAITAEYDDRLAQLEVAIKEYDNRLRKIQESAQKDVDVRSKELTAQRRAIEDQIADSNRKWSTQLEAARERLTQAQLTTTNRDAAVSQAKERLTSIDKEIASLDGQRIALASEDQVRRLAARIYGVKPDQVTDEQASFVSVIWFGSLAALAALAGPLTAIVALALQNLNSTPRRESRLARSIRRAIVLWRSRHRPSRLVQSKKGTPEEKVIKEILYVPVLTNDPAQVRAAIAKDLPKEISDLVRLSIREEPVGHPT
jgi:hypothetical protein